ncbi:unnamed protein product [Bursaphelenchus xylophilus]|uniref:(pine wood nematode) hypothetical protein n=1 Tax=Bursaphelenchus xylophilus TaxID=6326 RepID=A0A1I7S6H1_BURXY|nr:unnamed protein product [Bursaphelenchus xylophilus]CAG9128002.1 unnamed protein product [Bursaphelenchus xylophilus]
MSVIRLASKSLIRICGPEATPFLQGIVTNDIFLLEAKKMIYSFILGPRGRIVSDLFIYSHERDNYLLEVDGFNRESFVKTLTLYRLRKKADIILDETPINFSETPVDGALEDARAKGFGYRLLGEVQASTSEEDYVERRMDYGIPEGRDELYDQIPLNVNGDIMNGISFDKGCYVGQELIARTHHTGVIRKRLVPFTATVENCEGFIRTLDNQRRGKVIRSKGFKGIGLVHLESIKEPLFVKKEPIKPRIPDWWPEELRDAN